MNTEMNGIIMVGIDNDDVFSKLELKDITANQLSRVYTELELIKIQILQLINSQRKVQKK